MAEEEAVGKDAEKEKSEEDDDTLVIVCQPVRPRERPAVRGSAVRECADCRSPIWLAPSGQKIAKEKPSILVCLGCASKRLEAEKDTKIMQPTREQLEEISGSFDGTRSGDSRAAKKDFRLSALKFKPLVSSSPFL